MSLPATRGLPRTRGCRRCGCWRCWPAPAAGQSVSRRCRTRSDSSNASWAHRCSSVRAALSPRPEPDGRPPLEHVVSSHATGTGCAVHMHARRGGFCCARPARVPPIRTRTILVQVALLDAEKSIKRGSRPRMSEYPTQTDPASAPNFRVGARRMHHPRCPCLSLPRRTHLRFPSQGALIRHPG
jgi:hypothetical protein